MSRLVQEVDLVEPLGAFNFHVVIGEDVVGFAEIAGLSGVIEYGSEHNPAGTVGEVNLRRGVTGDGMLWSWFDTVMHGTDDPRTITIVLLDGQRNPACAWVLTNARPVRWQGPRLDAAVAAPAIEELTVRPQAIDFHPLGRIPSSLTAGLGVNLRL